METVGRALIPQKVKEVTTEETRVLANLGDSDELSNNDPNNSGYRDDVDVRATIPSPEQINSGIRDKD